MILLPFATQGLHPPVRYHSLVQPLEFGGFARTGPTQDAPNPPDVACPAVPEEEAPGLPGLLEVTSTEVARSASAFEAVVSPTSYPDPDMNGPREFAIFDKNATLPVFLFAYSKQRSPLLD